MAAISGLGPLVNVPPAATGMSPAQARRLAVLEISEVLTREDGRRLALGLLDVREIAAASHVPNKPALWFALAADLGARFALMNAATRRENAERVSDWLTLTPKERAALG